MARSIYTFYVLVKVSGILNEVGLGDEEDCTEVGLPLALHWVFWALSSMASV